MAKIIREPLRASGLEGLFTWAKEIVSRAILDGRLLEGISADTTGVSVNHGLGRVPRGVVVVASSTAVSYATTNFTKTSITLTASSGTPEVSVWIF